MRKSAESLISGPLRRHYTKLTRGVFRSRPYNGFRRHRLRFAEKKKRVGKPLVISILNTTGKSRIRQFPGGDRQLESLGMAALSRLES